MVRSDHSATSKRGGVCMYYKNCLPLKVLDIRFVQESIAFDLRIGDNYVVSFLFIDDLWSLDNFELTLDTLAQKNTFLMVALGDFNANYSIGIIKISVVMKVEKLRQ